MCIFTEANYDDLCFHDNQLRGILLRFDGVQSDLLLDIDYINDASFEVDKHRWHLAAADLVFHGVTGLKYSTDWGDDRYQVCMSGDWITDVKRTLIQPQLVHLDRPYWRWEFDFALRSHLSFGAYGFTLRLRQEPLWWHESDLPLDKRA